MGEESRRTQQLLQSSKRWKDTQTSPERNRVWSEPAGRRMKKVFVVYYLSRNGHLEHPHFMEVPVSCPDGLYLKDVISRLNLLRGTGMASMYSWSSKRSYKHGFVWHDLSEDDYIHPVHGLDYVLKGSEILLLADDDPANHIHSAVKDSQEDSESSLLTFRGRNQPWSLYNLHEFKACKTESTGECDAKSVAADASTQTDDNRKRCGLGAENEHENQIAELEGSSGSPPPVDSSPETLESLMKADKRLMVAAAASGSTNEDVCNGAGGASQSGRVKVSSVLMQLISCGSFSFRDCGATAVKDHGLRLISQYRGQNVAGDGDGQVEDLMNYHPSFERVTLEEKAYFSGSVIETKRNEFLHLKRSSSQNADRVSQTQLELEQEMDSVGAKCTSRKPKASLNNSTHKEESPNDAVRPSNAACFNSQHHGRSKMDQATAS